MHQPPTLRDEQTAHQDHTVIVHSRHRHRQAVRQTIDDDGEDDEEAGEDVDCVTYEAWHLEGPEGDRGTAGDDVRGDGD